MDTGRETDGVEIEVETEEGVAVVEDARELERRLKETFGRAALTTRIEEQGERVVVNGEGWRFVARNDDSLVFKPGDTAYRLVRRSSDLTAVETEDDGAVVFVFEGEEVALRRGVEHRA